MYKRFVALVSVVDLHARPLPPALMYVAKSDMGCHQ